MTPDSLLDQTLIRLAELRVNYTSAFGLVFPLPTQSNQNLQPQYLISLSM